MKKYAVTGEYVTFKTMTVSGMKVIGLYKGAPVPPDVSQESIDHHLTMGLIEELPSEKAEKAPEPKPDTSKDDAKAKAEADAKAAHAAAAGHTGAKGA